MGLHARNGCGDHALLAREFSFLERRSDTYSPATSTHILNILPMIYLQKLGDATSTEQQTGKHPVVLGTVDIKDAFLMVDQEKPMAVSLHNKLYRVKKERTRSTPRSKHVVLEF